MASINNQQHSDKLVVLIVAEPGIITDHINETLLSTKDFDVIGPYAHGVDGVSKLRKQHIDAIIIDIGMSNENPLISVNRMMRIDENAKIIMTSTLSFSNIKKSMAGFEKGVADFILTPSDFTSTKTQHKFDQELLRMVQSLGRSRRNEGIREIDNAPITQKPPAAPPILRPFENTKPDIIAISSSTGGPQALFEVLTRLSPKFYVPILITQHMPKTFTGVLAGNLSTRTGKEVSEAKDNELVLPGHIYIAPGDYHMTVEKNGSEIRIKLNQDPPENYCRPSANPMLVSIAKVYGEKVCSVVLTGMGSDGKKGCKSIVSAGGQVIAQDFESSVVWGMPGAVSNASLCSKVLPLVEIAPVLNSLLNIK